MVDQRQSLTHLLVCHAARLRGLLKYIYNLTPPLSMPPKKKTKIPSRVAPANADSSLPEAVTFDGWTDEQETTLFKAISVYRLKPAGELYQTIVLNQWGSNVWGKKQACTSTSE